MVLLDLLGRRWALRILWELRAETLTFRELRTRCDMLSPSVLNTRLKELRESGFLETVSEGYAVTTSGRELLGHLEPLYLWSQKWSTAQTGPDPSRR